MEQLRRVYLFTDTIAWVGWRNYKMWVGYKNGMVFRYYRFEKEEYAKFFTCDNFDEEIRKIHYSKNFVNMNCIDSKQVYEMILTDSKVLADARENLCQTVNCKMRYDPFEN